MILTCLQVSICFAQQDDIESLEKVLDRKRDPKGKAETLLQLARLNMDVDQDKALAYAEKSLELGKELNDIVHQGKSLYIKARTFYNQREYNEALLMYEEAIPYFKNEIIDKFRADCYQDMGNIYFFKGRYPRAIYYYQKAFEIANKLNLLEDQAALQFNMALASNRTGEFIEAIPYYEKALAICQSCDCRLKKLNKYITSFATLLLNLAEYDKVDSLVKIGLDLSVEKKDTINILANTILLANSKFFKGDLVSAYEYNFSAQNLARTARDSSILGISLHNIALIMSEIGDFERADSSFHEALRIRELRSDKRGVFATKSGVGVMYMEMGKWEASTQIFSELESKLDQISEKEVQAYVLNNLAAIALHDNRLLEAENYSNQTIQLGGKIQQLVRVQDAKTTLAEVYLRQDKAPEAEKLLREILSWAKGKGKLSYQKEVLPLLSSACDKQGKKVAALSYWKAYQDVQEKIDEQHLKQDIIRKTLDYQMVARGEKNKAIQIQEKTELNFKIKDQRSILYVLIGVIVLAGILVFLLLWQGGKRRHTNHLLSEQNKVISKQKEEILSLNQNLELKVKERTRTLAKRNEQLKSFAFMNSHKVRAPLSNILGIFQMIREDGFHDKEEEQAFIEMAETSAKELDRVIRMINQKLSEEEENQEGI
ncbi:MAG: tetratricopeptide repeat protein [Bacteroidota bacterium]